MRMQADSTNKPSVVRFAVNLIFFRVACRFFAKLNSAHAAF